MNKSQRMVEEFHIEAGQYSQVTPAVPPAEVCELRRRLIQEELDEFVEAYQANDLIEVVDAIGDMLYVVYGAALAVGIDMEPIFAEIHRSNMTKFPASYRDDGKMLKGENFEAPRLAPLIAAQTWVEEG